MDRANRLRDWGTLVGMLATLVTVITFHVRDHEMLLSHDQVLGAWRSTGTPAVVKIQATYDERFLNQEKRIDKLESAIITAGTVATRIENKLDVLAEGQKALKESLDEHKKMSQPK